MLRFIGFILLILILATMFVSPVRNYMHSVFYKVKTELKEEQIIETVSTIKEFQKKINLKPTGKIDSTTQLALNTSSNRKSALVVKDTHSGGLKDDLTKRAKVQDEVLSFRLKSKDRVRQIQSALKRSGFYKGEIDGKIGPQTKRAIRAFQKLKGINPDGVVGPKTWEELNKF